MVFGGRYRLVDELGSGGMSLVWLAHDEVLQRDVALKVLRPQYLDDPKLSHAVYREAQSAARLSHQHIAGVFDYGESDPGTGVVMPFVVMELVHGITLAARLADRGPLPCDEALAICGQVAGALAVAHAHGLVHRDVKLSNVMLTSSGVKIVDFGISAIVGEMDRDAAGDLLGTPAYIAPERLEGGAVGTPADVYAIGVLLYRMVAGAYPWDAETPSGMLAAHLDTAPLPLPPELALPDGVRDLYERCLAQDPARRPTSAELASALAGTSPVASTLSAAHPEPDESTRPMRIDDAPSVRRLVADHWSRGRWAVVPALAVGLVALTILTLWAPAPAPHRTLTAATAPGCAVVYTVEPVSAQSFKGTIAVTNTGTAVIADPTLHFSWPGDQVVQSPTDWRQRDQDVSALLVGDEGLAPKQVVEVRFVAAYATNNTMPDDFGIGPVACQTAIAVAALAKAEADQPATPSAESPGPTGRQAGPGPAGPAAGPATQPEPPKPPKDPKPPKPPKDH